MIRRDDRHGTTTAFAVKHIKIGQLITEKLACQYCVRMVYDEAKCFEIIGYPVS